MVELANQAFRTSERTFCGTMEMTYSSDDADYDNFISVDQVSQLVTIAPRLEDKAGFYDQAYLRFSFSDFPDRVVFVQIISQVDECVYQSARFANQKVDAEYLLGSADLVVKLPELQFTPDCGLDSLAIISSEATAQETPNDLPFDTLVNFDPEKQQVTLFRQTSLAMLE